MDDEKQNQEQSREQSQQQDPQNQKPVPPVPPKKKKKKPAEDPRQRELRELIELKKMQQAAAEHREVAYEFPKEEKIVPKTFKDKWKNYWYHYKTTTWVTVFVVVIAGWMIKDIFFGPKYDLTVTTATQYNFSALNNDLQGYLTRYIPEDYNGDGKKNVSYSEITISLDPDTTMDPQLNAINMQKLMAVFASGEELLFILDQDAYDMLVENSGEGLFVDFTDRYGFLGDDIVQGDKIYIQDTRLGEALYLDRLEGEAFICVREMGGTADPSKESVQRAREASFGFIDSVLEESFPEAFAEQQNN